MRKKQGLTQESLEEVIECSVEFISLIERGVNAPTVAGLQGFADALKVEVRDLFTFDGRESR